MDHSYMFRPPEPPSSADRRKKRRALISAPVRVRAVRPDAATLDEVSTTVDVSRNGILFLSTNAVFHRGMDVSVTFPFTQAPGAPQSEQPGNVVRVSALSNGIFAVAISFGLSATAETATVPNTESENAARTTFNNSAKPEAVHLPLVLAVDSDGSARDVIKAYLGGEGYKVIAVDNAVAAREVLSILTPALLIAEIEGEGFPGFDLCAHIKSTPRLAHIPVILTTGSAFPSDYSNAHSLGAMVCMAKPYRQERLGHVVRLLVAPFGATADAEPPRIPDLTRRPKAPRTFRRSASGRLRLR